MAHTTLEVTDLPRRSILFGGPLFEPAIPPGTHNVSEGNLIRWSTLCNLGSRTSTFSSWPHPTGQLVHLQTQHAQHAPRKCACKRHPAPLREFHAQPPGKPRSTRVVTRNARKHGLQHRHHHAVRLKPLPVGVGRKCCKLFYPRVGADHELHARQHDLIRMAVRR